MRISLHLSENQNEVQKQIENCADILFRPLMIGEKEKTEAFLIYIEVAVSNLMLEDSVIGKLLNRLLSMDTKEIYSTLENNSLGISDTKELFTLEEAMAAMFAGNAVLFVDGYDRAIKIGSKGYPGSGVQKTDSEKGLRGSKEAFSESVKMNTALIRKRIRNAKMKAEEKQVGCYSATTTALLYLDGVGTGFEAMNSEVSVSEQLNATKGKITKRYKAKKFIAYFQNYTNTFLPVDKFEKYLVEAAQTEDIVGISVSTRPDCITKEYLDCLKKISEEYQVKISMEYGLQTVNYKTLNKIDRGHTLAEYLDAVLMTAPYGFEICTHIILNLPGDDMTDVIETAKILSALPVQIVKLHSLYIPKGSKMYEEYKEGKITLCDPEEYLDRLVNFICYVRKDMVIERLFSRVPKEDASFSNWGISWWKLKDRFDEIMETNDYMQGCKFDYLNGAALRRWEI